MLNYTEREKEQIISMFSIIHDTMRVRIKDNVSEILRKHHGEEEYDEDDERYFDSIKGDEVIVYNYHKSLDYPENDDWFILLDDNYPFTIECFEILEEYI